jgi:lipopolysaccharide export system protein LptA
MYNYGYFFEGGKLIDKGNVLTSDWGEYNTKNRQAVFYYNVHLKNPKYVLNSDTLYYDTRKSLAHIVGPSVIKSGQSIIHSSMGYFDTHNNKAQLFGRSTVDNKGKTITGDSLYYNSKTGVSRGYRNVVCVDKIHKNKITCNHFFYNEKTGYAFATDNPVAMDYSQKDTLYVHADTMKLFTFHINTDSVYRKMHAYHKVRAFRVDMQAVCDSLVLNSKDSSMVMYKDPIVWSDNRQLLGEVINVFMNDSTIRFAHIVGQALSIEQMKDSVHFNQIASKEMKAYFIDGNLRKSQAEGNVRSVYYPTDSKDSSLIGLNYTETDTMKMYINTLRKLDKIWTSKVDCTMYPMTQIPPNMYKLPNFAWFDYIRPLNKDDIYVWRAKKADAILRPEKRREAPVQYIDKEKGASQ